MSSLKATALGKGPGISLSIGHRGFPMKCDNVVNGNDGGTLE